MALDAKMRTESDSLGSMEIPADAYWGIHTARALENFPISMRPISVYRDLVKALAMVKQASARANRQIGVLEPALADLIGYTNDVAKSDSNAGKYFFANATDEGIRDYLKGVLAAKPALETA